MSSKKLRNISKKIAKKLAKKLGFGSWQNFKPELYTSLFSSGGLHETFLAKELNLLSAVSCEMVPKRARWYCETVGKHSEMVCDDITKPGVLDRLVKLHKEKGCTGLIASPVCTEYTLANQKRNPNSKNGQLYKYVLEFVRRTMPTWIAIENSDQMMKVAVDGKIVGMTIVDALKAMGYYVAYGIQDCAGFFCAQHRKRTIIIAHLHHQPVLPTPSDKIITLREAIGHLPVLECGQKSNIKWHDASMFTWSAPQIAVMAHTPSGKSAQDNPLPYRPCKKDGTPSKARFDCAFQRRDWNNACNTLMQDSKSISGFRTCHPGNFVGYDKDGLPLYDSCRPLTVLELYLISGINPDENGDLPIPAWASDNLIRQMIGEQWNPKHCLAVLRSLVR